MKTQGLIGLAALLMLTPACFGQKATSKNDTYLRAKDREKLNKAQQQAKASSDVDSREDNFSRSSRGDDDYCYSCRVRRYSTGVWADPWWGPGWGWRSWYAPGWGWSYRGAASWGPAWDPWWGWGPAYAGPGWYYSPGWGWSYYAGPGWWMSPSSGGASSGPRYNYRPRTYTTPSGSTTYTPPRGTVITPGGGTPPRRSATPSSTSPSRPSYSPSPGYRGGSRPSVQSGSTGGGGVRSSSGATGRPR